MESRQLSQIHSLLERTENKSLFATVSSIQALTHTPIPFSGEEMFQKAAHLIRRANQEVLIAFYKFEMDSEAATQVLSALKELKARAEEQKKVINVYFLLNSRGALAELLYRANASVDFSMFQNCDYFKFHFNRQITVAMGSLHNKMIIVDGRSALLLSGDPQHANNEDKHQIESAVLLHDNICKVIRQDFVTLWHSIPPEKGEPQQIDNLKVESSAGALTYSGDLPQYTIPCIYLSKHANGNPFTLTTFFSPFKLALIHAITHARESIKIITPNLNDPDICEAIVNACKRKVKTSVVIGKHHNDRTEGLWGGTNFESVTAIMAKLTAEELYYFNVKWATTFDKRVVKHGDTHTIHSKFICIDDELVFIGSSPLDTQAMKYSREADVVFEDKHAAKLFCAKLFNHAFQYNKDFYEDTYYQLFIEIELQLIRIEKLIDNPLKLGKAEKLKEVLRLSSIDSSNYQEKLFSLLQTTLPILRIVTGNKPGMPTSYNVIVAFAVKHGLSEKLEAPLSPLARHSILRPASAEPIESKPEVTPSEIFVLSNSR